MCNYWHYNGHQFFYIFQLIIFYLPGEPEKGVRDVGGDIGPPGLEDPKIRPGDVTNGGCGDDEGEEGLLAVPIPGGLILFSFCRLSQQ